MRYGRRCSRKLARLVRGGEPTGGLESGTGGAGGAGATGAASVGAAGKLAGTSGAAVKAGLSAGAWLKAFGVGGGLTAAALMGHELTSAPRPEPAPMAIPSSIVAQPTTPVRLPVVKPLESSARVPDVDIEPPANAPIASRSTTLPAASTEVSDAAADVRWESAAVARARAQLRSGQPQEAMTTLHEIERRVSNGILGQEREALAIEALAASGQSSAASSRAAAFVERYPNSPHASRVRAFVRP